MEQVKYILIKFKKYKIIKSKNHIHTKYIHNISKYDQLCKMK